jgi:hypothetical protein
MLISKGYSIVFEEVAPIIKGFSISPEEVAAPISK